MAITSSLEGYGEMTLRLRYLIVQFGVTETDFARLMVYVKNRAAYSHDGIMYAYAAQTIEANIRAGLYEEPQIVQVFADKYL